MLHCISACSVLGMVWICQATLLRHMSVTRFCPRLQARRRTAAMQRSRAERNRKRRKTKDGDEAGNAEEDDGDDEDADSDYDFEKDHEARSKCCPCRSCCSRCWLAAHDVWQAEMALDCCATSAASSCLLPQASPLHSCLSGCCACFINHTMVTLVTRLYTGCCRRWTGRRTLPRPSSR